MKSIINAIKWRLSMKSNWFAVRLLSDSEQQKLIIHQIKSHMLFFGFDVSEMTDEELIAGSIEMANLFRKTAITANDAANALKKIATAGKICISINDENN